MWIILDLSKKDFGAGRISGRNTWKEKILFSQEGVVHIGLDEYYGSGRISAGLPNEMITMVQEERTFSASLGKPEPQ